MSDESTGKIGQINHVLKRKRPLQFVYAPNYWQWFAHQRNHRLLPDEIAHCHSQLDLIRFLGLDVFSRNIYCDEQEYWFGGLADVDWKGMVVEKKAKWENGDKIIEIIYNSKFGRLSERLRYDFKQSTLVQEKFLIDDYENQMDAFEDLLLKRLWEFKPERYLEAQKKVGDDGVVVAGELHSPLKMLHFLAGPVTATYMLADHPERLKELMSLHEKAQLDLVRQMLEAGVHVIMSMDNLDTMFHSPEYVEKYSASFYQKASSICHEYGSLFFIHACGRQKDNLALISSLGVDGLEGVAYPPLGDVELDEAMKISGERFILTGGISALETTNMTDRKQVYKYIEALFKKMKPYANRFILSASCNTPINTSWESIKWFRDAWQTFADYS